MAKMKLILVCDDANYRIKLASSPASMGIGMQKSVGFEDTD